MGKRIMLSSRIDEQVLFTFAGVALLAFIIFGFRYATHETCQPISIQVNDDLAQGKIVLMNAETKGGKSFHWEFGDGKSAEESNASTTHTYTYPGRYTVSVLVNGSCTQLIDITIKAAAPATSSMPRINILNMLNDTVYINKEVLFYDDAQTSTSWNWNFGEPGAAGGSARKETYTYTTPGQKRIVLTVNGKPELTDTRFIYVDREPKKIEVKTTKPTTPYVKPIKDVPDADALQKPDSTPSLPAPVPVPEPTPGKAPTAEPGVIEGILKRIPNGADWHEGLGKYVCGNFDIKVRYEGGTMSLKDFCAELAKMKKNSIQSVIVEPNIGKQTNCIQSFSNITVKKYNLIDRLLRKNKDKKD